MTRDDKGAISPAAAPAGEQQSTAATAGPLSPEQLAELGRANTRARAILRATRLSSFNCWILALCALICFPLAFSDIASIPIGACLGALAYTEFRGGKLLRAYDLRGPRLLVINQLVLLGLIVLYCGWQIVKAQSGPPDLSAALLSSDPALEEMLNDGSSADMNLMLDSFGDLYQTIVIIMYSAIIAASILFQSLFALYYFKRGKLLQSYLEETPPWVVEIQRQG